MTPAPRPLLALALAALPLLACGSPSQPDPVGLAALAGRSATLVVKDVDLLGDQTLPGGHRVTLRIDDLPDGTCTRLADGVSATLDGEPMHLERGGVADVPGRSVCLAPTATFDFDPATWAAQPPADLELLLQEQGAAPVRLRVRGGRAKRGFTVVAPASATTLRAGETRRYTYAPATDAGGSAQAALSPTGSSVSGPLATVLEPDGRIRVDVPSTVPAGNQELDLSRTAPAELLACEGLAACAGSLEHAETVAVDIVP